MQFIEWLLPTLDKLPRTQKFLLGGRMQGTALDVLERLSEATYSKARGQHLGEANLGIEKLRFLFRILRRSAFPRPSSLRPCGAHPRRNRPHGGRLVRSGCSRSLTASAGRHTTRGGSWNNEPESVRSANRKGVCRKTAISTSLPVSSVPVLS